MKKAISFLKRFWPLGVLFLVEIVLFFTNYKSDTYLMGWDNVMPEFNFKVNFMRNIFGVWQEYRGLGLYDGMSHIALILHTMYIWLLSFVFPLNLLRYIFQHLTHFAGMLGMYILLHHLLQNKRASQFLALFGSLFYGFNFATIEMFFTPLEVFSVHFATLPWITFAAFSYFNNPSRKSLFLFLIVSLATTPQYFVPTLFVTVTLLLTLISTGYLIVVYRQKQIKNWIRKVLILSISFICVNAFWLLPYVYGVPTNSPIIKSAKINQMSSDEIFARNQAFGDISSILLLRSFAWDFVETNPISSTSTILMENWRNHMSTIPVLAISVIFALFSLSGFIISLIQIRRKGLVRCVNEFSFCLIFITGLIMLGTDIPGIKFIVQILRIWIPFFDEAFRFSFTKFGLMFGFSYTVLLTLFLVMVTPYISKTFKLIVYVAIFSGLFIYSFPVFSGNFYSQLLKVNLPEDYIHFFAYMQDLDPSARVAYLPQPQFWSWKYYNFGYVGSGFLWYGIPQTLMDRAFDPWSRDNENYYWEISHAIYSKDRELLYRVLEKYDIDYVVVDENIRSTSNYLSLQIPQITDLLKSDSSIVELARFGKLTAYQREPSTHDFISIQESLPDIFPRYESTDFDTAFQDYGNYILAKTENEADVVYPFRSLFTKRSVGEKDFSISENDSEIIIKSHLKVAENNTSYNLNKVENLEYDSRLIQSISQVFELDCASPRKGQKMLTEVSGASGSYLSFLTLDQRNCLSFGMNNLEHRNAHLVAVISRHIEGNPLRFSLINQTAKHTALETFLPKNTNWNTTYLILPPLAADGLGYDVYVINDSIGRYPSKNNLAEIKVYELPYFDLVKSNFFPGNTNFISNSTQIVISQAYQTYHPNPAEYFVKITDPTKIKDETTLILAQSFHPGWLAFEKTELFPYFKQLTNHVLVNNWANGWQLDDGSQFTDRSNCQLRTANCELTVYILFWPQLLEFVGFTLLPTSLLLCLHRPKHRGIL